MDYSIFMASGARIDKSVKVSRASYHAMEAMCYCFRILFRLPIQVEKVVMKVLSFMEAYFIADIMGTIDQGLEEATLTWAQINVFNKHQAK